MLPTRNTAFDRFLLDQAHDLIAQSVAYRDQAGDLLTAKEESALERHIELGRVLLNESCPADETEPIPLD